MRRFQALNRYWRLLAHYLRPLKPRMILLAVILCGTIGVQVATPLVASRFIDQATSGGALRDLTFLALLTMGLALVGQGVAVAETYVAENVSWTATNALRADLVAHLLRLDAAFHTAHTPGELIERVDGDVATLARFFSRFVVYVLGNGVLMLGVLGLLFHVDWRIGLGLSAFVAAGPGRHAAHPRRATPSWAAERQASADFYGFLGEYLAGLEDIRSSGAGAFVLRRCAEVMRSWLAVTLKAQMRGYAMIATSQGLFALGTAVAFALSAMLFRAGTLTIGTVYLIFQYTEMLRQPTEQIRNEVQDLQQADASMGRVEALLRTAPRLADGPGLALPPGPLAVELDGVSFGYAEDTPVLRDVSVRLEPGRVLGVVGRTGSGKTTLTRLLLRFYDPLAGAVRLGGVDLRTVRLAAVRARIGLVTQEVHLFNASVRDNLTLFDDTCRMTGSAPCWTPWAWPAGCGSCRVGWTPCWDRRHRALRRAGPGAGLCTHLAARPRPGDPGRGILAPRPGHGAAACIPPWAGCSPVVPASSWRTGWPPSPTPTTSLSWRMGRCASTGHGVPWPPTLPRALPRCCGSPRRRSSHEAAADLALSAWTWPVIRPGSSCSTPLLWSTMNLLIAPAGADRPRLLRYAHRTGTPARGHDGPDSAAGGDRRGSCGRGAHGGFAEIILRFIASGLLRRNLLRHVLDRPGAHTLALSPLAKPSAAFATMSIRPRIAWIGSVRLWSMA